MLNAIPEELSDTTAREAARDAGLVSCFLHELGLVPPDDHPVRFPAAFLLRLGAALRLLVWESNGLRVHLEMGLPSAERAIVDAFGLLDTTAEASQPVDFPRSVVALFADRFAWHGRPNLDADVVLDDHVEGDALVEALAQLLWDARHTRKPVEETSDG